MVQAILSFFRTGPDKPRIDGGPSVIDRIYARKRGPAPAHLSMPLAALAWEPGPARPGRRPGQGCGASKMPRYFSSVPHHFGDPEVAVQIK